MSCLPVARLWDFACEAPLRYCHDVLALENQTHQHASSLARSGFGRCRTSEFPWFDGFLMQCQVPPLPCANPPVARCSSKRKSATLYLSRMHLSSSTITACNVLGERLLALAQCSNACCARSKAQCAPRTAVINHDRTCPLAEPHGTEKVDILITKFLPRFTSLARWHVTSMCVPVSPFRLP